MRPTPGLVMRLYNRLGALLAGAALAIVCTSPKGGMDMFIAALAVFCFLFSAWVPDPQAQ